MLVAWSFSSMAYGPLSERMGRRKPLYVASLAATMALWSIVVFVPGHAFVGWHAVAKDGTNGKPIFLETTMVGGYEFEQALKVANARVQQELEQNHFKTGASHMLDIGTIRSGGFGAMPM